MNERIWKETEVFEIVFINEAQKKKHEKYNC